MKRLVIVVVILMLALSACGGPGSDDEVTTIRLPMGFIADPQYAPFYVAVERGYFAEEGLALEFDYSFETDGVALVGAGELPFAVVSGEQVLLARAQELPVVFVMEWFQRFPIAIIARADSGITTPNDLVGRTVGLPGFFGASYVGYVGLLEANGLTQADVNAEDIGFTQVESLREGRVEAVVGYVNNEPIQLATIGEDVVVLPVADYIDLVANGILTNEETIADNPELIERFLRPLYRGLVDTLDDPAAAFEISKKYVEGLGDDRRAVLDASLSLWRAEPLGSSDPASWATTQSVLLAMGFMSEPLEDVNAAYTNEFIERVAR